MVLSHFTVSLFPLLWWLHQDLRKPWVLAPVCIWDFSFSLGNKLTHPS
ncbi:rCG50558 [Rattus norvegicus]|uniref:RCG50558 n=1 Tax=Rattus norvegicus TaxID=10116 RepID=A6KC46_RAT|nr:rCG50558 [Rattus norvegicus]